MNARAVVTPAVDQPSSRAAPREAAAPAVATKGFSLCLGDKEVLRDIDLEVPAQQFIAVIGPSGSGKSTLLNAIAGFITPATPGVDMRGEVLLTGSPPSERKVRCGVVFQEYALYPWRTARRNIEFALEALGLPPAERRERSLRYLRQVGLAASADLYPHQLSGGMKQRVAIARALAYEPSVLLMDEPLGALDALTREKLMRLIEQVRRESKTTVVYVTHNVSEAVFLADRVVILKGGPGEVVLDAAIDLPRPRDPYHPRAAALERELRNAIPDMPSGDDDA
jgi:NitT/TauT family transport system ATP-binding protein